MKISEIIPLEPQSWCKNPKGYIRHQLQLKKLAEWLESQNLILALPEDTGSWDRGIDLYIGSLKIDLKSFGLNPNRLSLTWDSPHYRGRSAPLYRGSETDYFIHASQAQPQTWIAAPAKALRTSKYGYQPYYFKSDCVTVEQLAQDGFTRPPFSCII